MIAMMCLAPEHPAMCWMAPLMQQAGEIWRSTLEAYTPPPLGDAIRAELDDYVTRRCRELGD